LAKEDRIEVVGVQRVVYTRTEEAAYEVTYLWKVINQEISFFYFPGRKEPRDVEWHQKPIFQISKSWWNFFCNRTRTIGKDHAARYAEKKKIANNQEEESKKDNPPQLKLFD
jgi:hypothetical protein